MVFAKPKAYVTGLNCRNGDYFDNNATLLALCESACLDFNLRDLFPTDPATTGGVLVENATERDRIKAQIARARSLRTFLNRQYYLELRPRSGFWDPDWFKNRVGRIPYATDNGWSADMAPYKGAAVDGSPGAYYFTLDCSKFWDPAGIPLRQLMTAKLFDLFFSTDPTDNVVALTVAWTSTQFTEVANKQGSIQANVDTLVANGYTLDAEKAMLVASWQDALPRAKQYGVSIGTSWNTYGSIDTTRTPAKFKPVSAEDYTFGLIDQMVSILGVFGQPQNHSFDQTFIGGDRTSSAERRMWDKLASLQCQISEQTATLTKMKADGLTVKGAVEALLTMGSLRCELPAGCEKSSAGDGNYIDQAYAQTWSPKLAYRAERDPATTPGGGGGTSGTWASDWLPATQTGGQDLVLNLPATIPDNSTLWLFPAAGASVTITGVTGGSGAPVPVKAPGDSTGAAAADDANGSNLHSIGWRLPVGSSDGGHPVTVHLSAAARGLVIGRISLGWEQADASVALIGTDTGASPTVIPAGTDVAGPTLLVTIARVSSGTTTIGQPGGTPASSGTADTAAPTGYNVIARAVELAPGQTGAGTITTTPAALKSTTYAVALKSPAAPVDPNPPVDPGTPTPTDPAPSGGTPGPAPTPTAPPAPSLPDTAVRWVGVHHTGRVLAQLATLEPKDSLRRTAGRAETGAFVFYLDTRRGPVDPGWAAATLEGGAALIGYTGAPGAEKIVWGGIVIRRQVTGAGVIELTAATPEAYFAGRYTGNLALSGRPSQVIAALAVRASQGDSRVVGSFGWTFRTKVVDTAATGGTPTAWQWKDVDDKSILSAIQDVAAGGDDVPDAQWCTGWVWEHGTGPGGTDLVLPTLTAGRRIGRDSTITGQPPVGFTQDMMVESTFATDFGSGNGATLVTATAAASGSQQRVAGYATGGPDGAPSRPLWELRTSGPSTATSAAALAAYARSIAGEVWDGRQSVSVKLARAAAPRVGTDWDLGDDAQVTVPGFSGGGTSYGVVTKTGQIAGYDLTEDTVTPYVAIDGGDGQ